MRPVPDTAGDRALKTIDEDIEFVRSVLSTLGNDAKKLSDQLQAVCAKREDDRLYLAVVGEFSSGKSSFVNALLGALVLPTSAMVTTAVATEIHPRPPDELEIHLHGLGHALRWPENSDAIARALGRHGHEKPLPNDLAGVITAVTTVDGEAARAVRDIRLCWSRQLLGEGVVVIDTPGLNSTAAGHLEVIRRVIAERVDGFVVLVPS